MQLRMNTRPSVHHHCLLSFSSAHLHLSQNVRDIDLSVHIRRLLFSISLRTSFNSCFRAPIFLFDSLTHFPFTYYALPVFRFWCYFDGSLSHEQLPQRYLLILNPRLASPSLALIVRPQRKPADLRAPFPHALEATCACYYYIAATATAASWPKKYKYHVRAIAP